MKKVVGYARFSSNSQKADSIEIQKKYIQKFCEDNNLVLDKVFADYAKSGSTTAGRDEFKKMRDYLFENDDISGVVCYKLDRLGRNTSDFLIFLQEAKCYGKSVQSYSEIHSEDISPIEKFHHTITAAVAELELATIRERTYNGIMHKAKGGTGSLGGLPPLGYTRPNPEEPLQVDPAKAPIVKKIFDLYTNKGKGYGEIAKILNSYGYLTQRGTEFVKNSIPDILRNERYTGTEVYNRSESKKIGVDGEYHYNTHRSKSEAEIIRHPNAHEAIISKELFEETQRLLDSRSRHGGNRSKALFTGMVKCGICGKPMHIDTHSNKGRNGKRYVTRKYRCNCYNDGGAHATMDADIAEGLFIKMLQQGLFDNVKSSEILEIMDSFFKENSSDFKKLELHKERVENYLKKIKKLVSAMENAKTEAAAKMLQDKMDSYGKEIEELQKQINILEESCQRNYTTKDIKYITNNFQQILMESSREQETVDFIRSYLHGVTLGADYMEIELSDSVSEEEEQAVA